MAPYDDDEDQQDDFHPKREDEGGEGTQKDVKAKIVLTVKHQTDDLTVAVSLKTPFSKVFDAAYTRFNRKKGTIRFLYDGERLRADQTPGEFNMQDGDIIDAHIEQLGGCCKVSAGT